MPISSGFGGFGGQTGTIGQGQRDSSPRKRVSSPDLGVGQIKLDPPRRFNGAKKPGVDKWIAAMTTWMTLMSYPARKWVLIASTRLGGHALSRYSSHVKGADQMDQPVWGTWTEFCGALRRIFSPLDDEEEARRQLKEL